MHLGNFNATLTIPLCIHLRHYFFSTERDKSTNVRGAVIIRKSNNITTFQDQDVNHPSHTASQKLQSNIDATIDRTFTASELHNKAFFGTAPSSQFPELIFRFWPSSRFSCICICIHQQSSCQGKGGGGPTFHENLRGESKTINNFHLPSSYSSPGDTNKNSNRYELIFLSPGACTFHP